MKLWKTIFSLCLALTMVLAMAACTGTPEETTGATGGRTCQKSNCAAAKPCSGAKGKGKG